MRPPYGGWVLFCLLLLLPFRATAQRRLDESQRERIGITSQQQKEIEALFAGVEQQRRTLHAKLHALCDELHSIYDAYDFDTQRAHALREQIGVQHQQLIALYAATEIKLRHVLNREQFDKLRAIMKAQRAAYHRKNAPIQRKGSGDSTHE